MLNEPRVVLPLLWAGLACGILDITAALIVYGFFGLKPIRLLQGIASGLLGPQAFEGGLATALLGLLCHFLIAFTAATPSFSAHPVLPFPSAHSFVFCVSCTRAAFFFFYTTECSAHA